jgi:hypothetical protein
MNRRFRRLVVLALLAILHVTGRSLLAQRSVPPRQFAPGILTTIRPAPEAQEMFSGPLPLAEIPIALEGLDYDPKLSSKSATAVERSKAVVLRRTVWNLEFSFKPMRMLYVDVPQGTGRMQRKLVWYMVYRIRNLGQHLKPKESDADIQGLLEPTVPDPKELYEKFKDVTNEVEIFGRKTTGLRFFPHFVLASLEYQKEYLDRVVPAALAPIQAREFPGRSEQKLYNSLSISELPIEVSDENNDHSVWGLVTWSDIDPRIDFFAVYVQGLTNAYQFDDPPAAYKKGDTPGTGRKITHKTLQLNFWRPGDTIDPNEEEIRFGCRVDPDPVEQQSILRRYGVEKPVDYLWIYR